MRLLVIGTREDVAGFALAGVDGVVCETAAEAIEKAGEDVLVIVSNELVVGGWPLAVALPRGS